MKSPSHFPLLTLKDQRGKPFDMNTLKGKPFVVYFYPKDDTPGCTKQACSFRDAHQDFQDLGVTVVGVSGDSPSSHAQFAKKHNLPFTLLSDSKKALRKEVNVPTNILGIIPGRVTYIMDANAKIAHVFNSQTKAEQHMEEALVTVRKLLR